LAVLLAGVSGCGSSSSSSGLSEADFVAKANAACATAHEKAEPGLSLLSQGTGPTAASLTAYATQIRTLRTSLGAVPPPSQKRAEYTNGLYQLERLASTVDKAANALQSGSNASLPPEAFFSAESELENQAKELEGSARTLGLTTCAEVLHKQNYG
jgi:hypothetical protein